MSTPALKLAEIADAVFRIPGVEWGFVYQEEERNVCAFAPISGVPGARRERITRDSSFRVGLRANDKFATCTKPKLRDALRDVFAGTGIDLAEKQSKLSTLHDEARQRKPKGGLDEKEHAAEVKRLSGEVDYIAETREVLSKLSQWLEAVPAADVPRANPQPLASNQLV